MDSDFRLSLEQVDAPEPVEVYVVQDGSLRTLTGWEAILWRIMTVVDEYRTLADKREEGL